MAGTCLFVFFSLLTWTLPGLEVSFTSSGAIIGWKAWLLVYALCPPRFLFPSCVVSYIFIDRLRYSYTSRLHTTSRIGASHE